MEKEDILKKYSCWKKAVKIYLLPQKEIDISKLSEKLGEYRQSSYFTGVLHVLEKENIIKIDKSREPYLIYNINKGKLLKLLREAEPYKLFKKLTKLVIT